jgi:2-C-methyl-D-erythritol 2,4-cyclodiphosphate synthase
MSIRVGFGFDVHQLVEQKDFWLGGIKVAHYKGAVGHSDADVLIHAICDAILGAANLRDIGFHFPDTSASYKGIDSKILLKDVMILLEKAGYKIGNIDATISLQKPKINPHIPKMIAVLSEVMGITENQLSLKATTTEKLGYVGTEDGVNAHAVVLIESK